MGSQSGQKRLRCYIVCYLYALFFFWKRCIRCDECWPELRHRKCFFRSYSWKLAEDFNLDYNSTITSSLWEHFPEKGTMCAARRLESCRSRPVKALVQSLTLGRANAVNPWFFYFFFFPLCSPKSLWIWSNLSVQDEPLWNQLRQKAACFALRRLGGGVSLLFLWLWRFSVVLAALMSWFRVLQN